MTLTFKVAMQDIFLKTPSNQVGQLSSGSSFMIRFVIYHLCQIIYVAKEVMLQTSLAGRSHTRIHTILVL